MSPQDLLTKIQLFVALWRSRRFDQLAAAGAVGGAGAFLWVLAGKTPVPLSAPYREVALLVLGLFAVGCALFLIVRISRLQDPNTAAGAQQALPSSVRGPLPFTEADGDLFRKLGRDYLVGQALAYVTNDQIPVILVSGESGVGKTSLLRAGLTGPLKEGFGRSVVYWEARPTNPLESLTATVVNGIGESSGVTSFDDLFHKKPLVVRPVVIIDQLEQLSPSNEAHAPVFDLIAKAAQSSAPHPATWIIAFRRDFVGIYEFLAAHGLALPFVLVTAFTRDQAEQVMATLADKAGVSFERQLLKDFTGSAAVNGAVSSVDIGIGTLVLVNLAKRAKKDTITLDDYKFAGGSSGVLTAYVKDQLSVYPDVWQDAVLKSLLSLVDLSKNQRIAEGRSASSLAAGSTLPPGRLALILDTLAAPHIRILEKLEDSTGADPVYRLPHERLIQPIRTLAGSLLAKENLAQFVLDNGFSGWMRSRDPRLLLSGKDLKQVRDLVAQRGATLPPDALDYVRRSLRREHFKIVQRSALCVGGILLLAALALRVQWIPQTIADTRANKNGWVTVTSFPDAGIVMTSTSGDDPNKSFLLEHNLRFWRANDGKLLHEIPGALRATCMSPPSVLISDINGNNLSVVDTKQFRSTNLRGSIGFNETVWFLGLCEYVGFLHGENSNGAKEAQSQPSLFGALFETPNKVQTLYSWNSTTGAPILTPGNYSAASLNGAYPNMDSSKSRFFLFTNWKQTKNAVALWNISSNQPVAYLCRHNGGSSYAVDYPHALVAVTEDIGNGQIAIELWNMYSGAFLREVSVDGPVSGLRFVSGGSLLFFQSPDNTGSLLRVDNLSRSPLVGSKAKANQNVAGPVWIQSGKDLIILGSVSPGVLRVLDLDIDSLNTFIANDALDAAIVLTKGGSLKVCGNSAPCKPIAAGVSFIGALVGSENVYARSKQDNSLELFDYEGKSLGKGLRGDWGTAMAISRNSHCGDVFAWSTSSDLLRYRARWTFFGRPFVDVHLGCRDE